MINFNDYLDRQKTEDRRAFIIHFPARSGKTQFARRVHEIRSDVSLIDLQADFASQPDRLPIRRFDFQEFRGLLLSLDVPQPVIMVDNPDFLFNTWNAEEKQALLHWLRIGLRSPGDTLKTFVLIVQDDDVLARAQFFNTNHEPRVITLNTFESV